MQQGYCYGVINNVHHKPSSPIHSRGPQLVPNPILRDLLNLRWCPPIFAGRSRGLAAILWVERGGSYHGGPAPHYLLAMSTAWHTALPLTAAWRDGATWQTALTASQQQGAEVTTILLAAPWSGSSPFPAPVGCHSTMKTSGSIWDSQHFIFCEFFLSFFPPWILLAIPSFAKLRFR